MSATTFYVTLLVGWILLYLALPGWLMLRGWVVSAGLFQLVGAILPAIWQAVFWPDEAGNLYLLVMLLLPIPACIITVGVSILLFRAIRWGLRILRRHPT